MTFTAEIRAGKVIWSDREAVRKHVAGLEGKRVSISIDVRRPRRSDEQNRYFHGVVCKLISEHTGMETEEVKEYLKQRFLLIEKNGRTFCRSTATLNVADFGEFLEKCIRWAAMELGIVIPEAA